jgi:hypothetical protein
MMCDQLIIQKCHCCSIARVCAPIVRVKGQHAKRKIPVEQNFKKKGKKMNFKKIK